MKEMNELLCRESVVVVVVGERVNDLLVTSGRCLARQLSREVIWVQRKKYDWGLDDRWLWFVPIDIGIHSRGCTDGGKVRVHEAGILVELVGSLFDLFLGARS